MKKINKKFKKSSLLLIILFLLLLLASCGEETQKNECEHVYKDGKCIYCELECNHPGFDDDICTVCGEKLQDVCHHEFLDGECTNCFYECPHDSVTHGVCDLCHMNIQNKCLHTFSDGVCTRCEYHCPHEAISKGFCLKCGIDYRTICSHTFESGVCSKCTFVCTHEETRCGEVCAICQTVAGHQFENGKCKECGLEMNITASSIPSEYLASCPEQGTVEKVTFTSYDYNNKCDYQATFYVYLPYGYQTSGIEYNVLYLLHGSGENSAYWLAQGSYKGGYTEQTKVLLDNMHYYKLCEPTIVVTPTDNQNTRYQFHLELIGNIMPLAETKYRTKAHLYGKDVSQIKESDFTSSRDYRAFAGLSRGSIIAWNIMATNIASFSYYGMYSGAGYYFYDPCKETLQSTSYDIKYAYHSCGDNDSMYQAHIDEYKAIIKDSNGKLNDNVNCLFLVKPGFKHNYSSWLIDLYNSLGYCFFKFND